MTEIAYIPSLPRAELRRALLRHGGGLDPRLRILAEDLLGAGSTIDMVAVDPAGSAVIILIGEEGDDLATFTRGLAHCAWVGPRIPDWLKLAPSLGLDPAAPVRLLLLCPSYADETVAAAASLGDRVELATTRCVRNGSDAVVLVERRQTPATADPAAAASGSPGTSARFRSGLTEDDLNLTPDEVREFE